jgi:hypothetical protein
MPQPHGERGIDEEFEESAFRDLSEVDQQLAAAMADEIVSAFIEHTGLSSRQGVLLRASLSMMVAFRGDTGSGLQALQISSTASAQSLTAEWDGSRAEALAIAGMLATTSIEGLAWDREQFGDTGWEPEFDA